MIETMRETNLAGVDLNLLPALEALIRHRNVTRAGEDVGLSQPAMSRALARLRHLLDDPILVKAPGGLAPTARAQGLLPHLSAALDSVGGLLRTQLFEPQALDRTFRIAATDAHTTLLGPPLMAMLREQAPRAGIRFVAVTADMRVRIETGDVDLAFALESTPLPPGAHSEPLALDRLALVTRRALRVRDTPWTLAEYAARDHVTVSIFGDGVSDTDTELGQAGLVRRIVLTTPHFLSALAVVGATDCVTTISAAVARRFADMFGLELHISPLRHTLLPTTTIVAATRAQDPGLVWLRARLKEVAHTVYGG